MAVARLVRQFHDLTPGTELARDQEVACHNDLSPKNTVYRDLGAGLRPTAFIDWDIAGPGARIHDACQSSPPPPRSQRASVKTATVKDSVAVSVAMSPSGWMPR